MSDAVQATAPSDRRDFLLKLGTGAGIAALTVQTAASLRSLVPNVSYDSPTTVKLGQPADFPDGIKFLPDERLFVFRDGKTFHAISAVCTHLGCTPIWHPAEERIKCPCHGSNFLMDGQNVAGPAPVPLFRAAISLDFAGNIVVDKALKENQPGKRDQPPFFLPLS